MGVRNYNWIYSIEKYKKRKKKKYENYKSVIDRVIEVFEKINDTDFYRRTSEKELNQYIDEVEEKLKKIEDRELLEILKPRITNMKCKVDEKWRYKLIEILAQTRKRKGYTLSELSKKSQISLTFIYRLENFQRHRIRFENLKSITNALEIDINDLILEAIKESEIEIENLPYELETIR